MPTNDERREVAAGLRRLAERYDGVVSDLVDVHLGLVPDERFIARSVYTSESVSHLADLIELEPERTCHAITTAKPFSQTHELHVKSCSSCGCVFQAEARRRMPPFYGEVVAGNQVKQPSYCPNCGAKLVE